MLTPTGCCLLTFRLPPPDPRAGARIRSSANDRMLSPDQLESLFTTYAAPDGGSALDNQPVLGYEAWLAALVATAQALKRPDQVYLSEMMRDLMSNYISRAHKVTPPGIKAGQVRQAGGVQQGRRGGGCGGGCGSKGEGACGEGRARDR